MLPLRLRSRGPRITQWQTFLLGQGLFHAEVTDYFGPVTRTATIAFQRRHRLTPDGVVGDGTLGQALLLGYSVHADPGDKSRVGPNWPPPPAFRPLVGTAARQRVFGRFRYEPAPTKASPERIRLLDDWARENIVRVELPQLVTRGLRKHPYIQAHRLVAEPLRALWQAWEDAGRLDLVLTWDGSYSARFRRGSRDTLSNHAFGTAFDINARYNRLGTTPALLDATGSVRALVPLANRHGFYWGGHFRGRPDGMHFEAGPLGGRMR